MLLIDHLTGRKEIISFLLKDSKTKRPSTYEAMKKVASTKDSDFLLSVSPEGHWERFMVGFSKEKRREVATALATKGYKFVSFREVYSNYPIIAKAMMEPYRAQ